MSSNFTFVQSGVYIVRTQAGLRQAFLKWNGRDSDAGKELKKLRGYPKVYPSLVSFGWQQDGCDGYPVCRAVRINHLLKMIKKSEEENFKDNVARIVSI